MENTSKKVLSIVCIDKRQTEGKSGAMEAFGFKKALKELMDKGINIVEVVTDGHLGIGALMSKGNIK